LAGFNEILLSSGSVSSRLGANYPSILFVLFQALAFPEIEHRTHQYYTRQFNKRR